MFDKLRIGDSAKESKPFTPVHPNEEIGKKHGISINLYGKHSEKYRNAVATTLRRAKKNPTTDEMVEQSARLIATCADGWEGVTDDDGKPRKFDRKVLHEMLLDDDFRWLRLQAEQFMQNDDNFF